MSIEYDVLARAASRIGYYAPDDPEVGSEAGRYWYHRSKGDWLLGPSTSVWWCMLFVSMCLDECGQIDAIGGFSCHTDVTINQARAAGCQFVNVYNAQPGDVVIFNWDGGGTDHVGFVERNLGGGVLQTIEGNTSSGAAGSQYAGNGVWRRWRSQGIAAIIRPAYNGVNAPVSSSGAALVVDGIPGPETLGALQRVAGTPQDRMVSSQYAPNLEYVPAAEGLSCWEWVYDAVGSLLIAAIQRALSVEADGILGPVTIRAWQRALGVTDDGYMGPITVKAIQAALNRGALW